MRILAVTVSDVKSWSLVLRTRNPTAALCLLLAGGFLSLNGFLPSGVSADGPAPPPVFAADARTDDTAALQAALDAAAKAGGSVTLGAGRYLIAGALRIPPGVTLQGTWQAPHHSAGLTGTVLLATGGAGRETGPALIEMTQNTALRGVTIAWPDQRLPGVIPYPFAVHGRGTHVTVEEVTLVNAYQGIAIGPEPNALHVIRDVYGCPLRTGVSVDNCTDVGRIEDVHWNPHYWARSGLASAPAGEAPVIDYERAHLDGFVFGRSDWEYVTNTFVFGALNGYRFVRTASGACNGQFTGIGADGGPCAVRLEAAQPMGLQFTNGEFVAMGWDHPTQIVAADTFDATAQWMNCSFWGPSDHIARLGGRGAYLFNGCHFREWRDKTTGAIATTSAGGRLLVVGCLFETGGPSVAAGRGTAQTVVQGDLGLVPAPPPVKVGPGHGVSRPGRPAGRRLPHS